MEVAKELVDAKVAVTFEKEDGSPFWSGAVVTICRWSSSW